MSEHTEPPRLDPVTFRGVSKPLPPRPAVVAPPAAPDTEADLAATTQQPQATADPQPSVGRSARGRTPTSKTARRQPSPPGPRSRVGTGQLHARLPVDLAEWLKDRDITQRAVLLAAFADHGDDIPPSNDPTVISRQRLGLPVRPPQKRRGPTELINFSLTGEEKDLIEARANQLSLSIVDFVIERLRRAQPDR